MKTEQTTNSVEEQQKQKQLVEEVNYLFMKYIAKMKLEVESLSNKKKNLKKNKLSNNTIKLKPDKLLEKKFMSSQ